MSDLLLHLPRSDPNFLWFSSTLPVPPLPAGLSGFICRVPALACCLLSCLRNRPTLTCPAPYLHNPAPPAGPARPQAFTLAEPPALGPRLGRLGCDGSRTSGRGVRLCVWDSGCGSRSG